MLVDKIKITSFALIAAVLLQTLSPVLSVSAQDKTEKAMSIQDGRTEADEFKQIPGLNPFLQIDVESFAQVVANNLVFNKNGTVSVNLKKVKGLTVREREQLDDVVRDISENHIGLAFADETGVKVFGNKQVLNELHPNNSPATSLNIGTWSDGYGLAIYLDPVFTRRLKSFDSAAIGAVIGLMVTFACGTGVGCFAVGVLVSWYWSEVWTWLDNRYFADSLIIHAPRWGWVYVQPFKARAWFDGQWFRTWLWT